MISTPHATMSDEIPEYHSPHETCLAVHAGEIAQLREKRWPYRAILERLESRHQIRVAYSTLREFCIRRKIGKAGAARQPVKPVGSKRAVPNSSPRPEAAASPEDDLLAPSPRKKLTLKVIKSSDHP